MQNQNFIEFKKKRDLGSIISDTFKFLSTEWKSFFGTILKAAIIPILIAVGAVIYYVMSSTAVFGEMAKTTDFDSAFDLNFAELIIPIFIFIGTYLVAYALVTVNALSYIKSYIDNKGVVNLEQVNILAKDKFGAYVGLFFLNGIILFVGALFCFFPAIYLGVVLSVSICFLIFQNKSVTESITDSFNFIKGHWWETFGVLIVVQLIIGLIGFLADLPATFYQLINTGFGLKNEDAVEVLNIFKDPIYIALMVFSYFIKFILYTVTTVATVFIYYDIKEQGNPSTTIINQIGVE
ncbi:hypothetical protein [Polaribacter butkevichii]|uniref:Glycerophosphoryl diester phosphodiesterase membrane domain-containing protein n=1 Tax=Polaribacter butkevichii TaxID=218490 RepID=A0A2P6CE72_9FLAO|nr:hypothetical protein [Polaribacter butkevichii]PQJ73214.1 hypothetical protein BTO14_08040 [Polaribacter butkevichii]